MTINTNKLNFDLGGGILAKIADKIIPLFKKGIKDQIERRVEQRLKTILPMFINERMQKENGYAHLWDIA